MTLGADGGIRTARLSRALGHPARVAIVQYQRTRPGGSPCSEIVRQLPLAQSTVSQHLRVLAEAGLVVGQSAPPRVTYRIEPRTFEEWRRLVAAL